MYPYNVPLTPISPYGAYLFGAPDMPELYWNVRSNEQRIKGICEEIAKLIEYCDNLATNENETREFANQIAVELHEAQRELEKIRDDVDAILAGGKIRNPMTGAYNRSYVAAKQTYDMLRVYASTWAELEALGKSYDEMEDNEYTYADVEMFGNIYWGNGQLRAKVTDPEKIDVNTPGFGYVKGE